MRNIVQACINGFRKSGISCTRKQFLFDTKILSYRKEGQRSIALDTETEPAVDPITIDKRERITLIGLNRPRCRNAVNRALARQLTVAFQAFEEDATSNVAVLHGKGDHFCSGYDLKELARGDDKWMLSEESLAHMSLHGAMGPTRIQLCKPVIAALNGFAVAGGLELALLCDIRIFEKSTKVGVLNRRFGVPLIDGGTVRLPRLVGLSHALDMMLTGRIVDADEAQRMGLANRIVEDGEALSEAVALAKEISKFPQGSLRADRNSMYNALYDSASIKEALDFELKNALDILSGEAIEGAKRFKAGSGRGGSKV